MSGLEMNKCEAAKLTEYSGKLPESIWILIDTSNGDRRTNNYLWWFETRKLALEFLKHHNKLYLHARLVGPFKYLSDNYVKEVRSTKE